MLNYLRKENEKRGFPGLNKVVLIVCVLVFGLAVAAAFADESEVSLSPINPEFEEYMDLVRAREAPQLITAEGYYLGLIPAPVDMSHT